MMKEWMKELSDLRKLEEIKASDAVNVLVFSANWCPDCRFYRAIPAKADRALQRLSLLVHRSG